MRFAIYDKTDGKIRRFNDSPYANVEIQCNEGEEYYLNCPSSATHIIDNEPVTITIAPTAEEIIAKIRRQRDNLLFSCDWTQLEDFPKPAAKKKEWKDYRQALRDFPETCDPENPVWPVVPS